MGRDETGKDEAGKDEKGKGEMGKGKRGRAGLWGKGYSAGFGRTNENGSDQSV
jgi:hypothetical protein